MTKKPLDGIRIIDFCVVWAGPFATMQLADLGAEVIKVENPFVFQPMTRGASAHPPEALIRAGNAWGSGMPRNELGDRPWDYSPTFVSLYRNKRSFTTNILQPEGMDVLKRLVEVSDVFYENNATGTMEGLGITYEWLKSINPKIIMLRVPAYGSTGPYYNARALGVHLEAVMGHSLLRGYDDADPSSNTAIYSGDYVAGTQGAFAVMAALMQREHTGEGQLIEIGQAENAAAMFTQSIMDYSLNRRVGSAIANRDIHGRAPFGVYPAISPGTSETSDDRWIAISCETDEQWQALVSEMGSPSWASEERFAKNDDRYANHKALDALIGTWTADQDDYDLMHRLQAAGIPAAPVLEASRMFDDPHLLARNFFRDQYTTSTKDTYRYVGPMWQFSETPVEFYQPPVTFGEHNDYVYREVLKYSDEEIEALRAKGHIATEYDPSVP